MIRDDIMQALRITAMGRFGHPLQEQLADKLVEVFAQLPKEHMDGCGVLPTEIPDGIVSPTVTPLMEQAIKRTRKAKAAD